MPTHNRLFPREDEFPRCRIVALRPRNAGDEIKAMILGQLNFRRVWDPMRGRCQSGLTDPFLKRTGRKVRGGVDSRPHDF